MRGAHEWDEPRQRGSSGHDLRLEYFGLKQMSYSRAVPERDVSDAQTVGDAIRINTYR